MEQDVSLHASRDSNLVDLLLARSAPDSIDATAIAFTHLEDGETVDDTITFVELDLRVRTLAARLQRMIATRDRVLLVYPPGIDYIVAFFACAYAGAIAVPALPPTNARTLPRLHGIADDCTPRIALAPAKVVARMEALQENESVDDTLTRLEW